MMLYRFKLKANSDWAYIESECPSAALKKIGSKVFKIEKAEQDQLPLEIPFAMWETGFTGGRLDIVAYFKDLQQAREYVDLQAVQGKSFEVVDRESMETVYPTPDTF